MKETCFDVSPGQSFTIDTFRPEDARGVVNLFSTIYGEGYPIKLVYDPQALVAAFNESENIPAVARTGKGDIVGCVSLYRSAPNPDLYEMGLGLVLPSYRCHGIGEGIIRYLCEVMAPRFHMQAIFGEAVCNHTHTQKSSVSIGAVETALEVDLMPSEAFVKEGSVSGRVSTINGFKIFRERPQTIYLPGVYEGELRAIYSRVVDPRTFIVSSEGLPAGIKTDITSRVFHFANVVRISVSTAGGDFERVLRESEEEALLQRVIVFQAWLKLTEPWVGAAVDILRSSGYFFGGLLPRWFDDDGILMQKITGRPNWEGINLYSDQAREILRFIRTDWERCL